MNFDITVCRIGYGFNTVSIEADTQADAEAIALDKAGDHYYSEKSSDYVLSDADPLVGFSTHSLTAELRRRGLPTSVWQPGDMEGFGDPNVNPQERLDECASSLEDRCIECGWQVIESLLGTNDVENA